VERARVLVVEDRPSVLAVMAAVLERACEVFTARDGPGALAVLASTRVDVVLTDVRMPDVSGFDVLRASLENAAHPQVVLMTAYANIPDAVAAVKLGAFDYVAKPIDADEIGLVVARALEWKRELPVRRSAGLRSAAAGAEGAGLDGAGSGFRQAIEHARDRASCEYLTGLLKTHGGNVTHAARAAGMTRESLHRVLRKYGIKSEAYRELELGEDSLESA
jgi:DNA-binding NtrC family response regulator